MFINFVAQEHHQINFNELMLHFYIPNTTSAAILDHLEAFLDHRSLHWKVNVS